MMGQSAWPRSWQRLVLLALALANAWSAWHTYSDHRLPAILNATAACVLLLLALWPGRKARERADNLP
jgi:DMSO/TMAO reductase YedYZ heme-binding membrane subunit